MTVRFCPRSQFPSSAPSASVSRIAVGADWIAVRIWLASVADRSAGEPIFDRQSIAIQPWSPVGHRIRSDWGRFLVELWSVPTGNWLASAADRNAGEPKFGQFWSDSESGPASVEFRSKSGCCRAKKIVSVTL